MGGRKEKEDRTRRRGCGRESWERTEHRSKSIQGTKFHFKNNFLYSLTDIFFIEIEEEQLRETSHRGNFRSRMNNHTRDNSSSIRHLRG